MNEQDLCGIYVPVVTPFHQNGEVDYKSYAGHIRMLLASGIHGLVINGTTGESPTVTMEEVKYLTEATKQIMGSARMPIVVGTGTNDTASTIKRTELAGKFGADAALIVVPYYSRPSQEGIIEHFRHITQIGLPVIAYDIPARTGVGMTLNTAKAILDMDGVIGLKDSSGDLKLISELVIVSSKPLLCGQDELFYAMLGLGANGGMLASANVQTEKFVQLYRNFMEGHKLQADNTFEQLLPLIRLLFKESNPAPLKWLLSRQGILESATLRLPMTSISYSLQHELEYYSSSVNY
jgi:4-hydroxy-tetrahydrodipicolinate synthase